jgi:fatty-acyl-CoA synthase
VVTHDKFCSQLRQRLLSQADKVILRVAMAPEFDYPVEFTGQALLDHAESLAASVVSSVHSTPNRQVILLLLPHCPELFLLQLGLVLKGYVPAILAWPTTRVDAEKYQRNLVHQVSHLPADALVTLPGLAESLRGSLPYAVNGLAIESELAFGKMFPTHVVKETLEATPSPKHSAQLADDVLFLQFSGGTTGAQKAVVVTADMLVRQFEQLNEFLTFTTGDSVVSWLPMYHDMGLIACYWAPLWHCARSLQIAANDWILNPELLFRYVAQYHGTLCWLPNFAFSYLSQRREFMQKSHALGSVRAWISCSEPVRQKSIAEFVHTFADWGVSKETMQASYAMAETVFAVTQSKLNRDLLAVPRTRVHRGGQTQNGLAFDLIDDVYVSSGKPLPQTQIRVVAPDGALCSENEPGEICVGTPSLFSGYWGSGGFQTHTLNDGWHATGDYGFMTDGELFVIGRFKDIVIVGGNNIFPEDVEAVVNTLDAVYPGRVVAFGVEDQEYGTQSLAIAAETKGDYDGTAAGALEAEIRKLVLATIGTAPRHVAVVPQRWIVKSTAGKISRKETRDRFLREWSLVAQRNAEL